MSLGLVNKDYIIENNIDDKLSKYPNNLSAGEKTVGFSCKNSINNIR